ncbi:hypothetical protein ACFSCW_03490 [Sphingomonas tabacisoli]|uniref:Uncharacterized protein n=1 Tax=Sphingomonas tabacisoli TaxID=2249466 RepID=A0ABW4I0B4_9SPHN
MDSVPSVTSRGELFAVEYPGVTLMMTPHALIALVGKGKASMNDWAAIQAAKIAGVVIDDPGAELVAFPKRKKIVRLKNGGEAC